MRILLAVVFVVFLTACRSPVETVTDDCTGACEVTVTYKGNPLDCIAWEGSHGEIGYTCDFVKYHAQFGGT